MTDTTPSIERVTAVDAEDVSALTAMLDTLVRGDAAIGWAQPPSEREVHDLVISLMTAGPAEACVLIARPPRDVQHHTPRVIGFGYWRRYARTTHRPHADLERLAVATEFGGQGIGRRLLQELIQTARDAGIEQLTIDFRGDNHRAEKLYISEGFREYGRLRDFVAPDERRRFDKVFQVLDLRG